MCKLYFELKKQWSENRADYVIQLIFLVIVGALITHFIISSLEPKTDIKVDCKISSGLNSNYTLDIFLNNKAPFGGKNFHVYVWGLGTGSWSSSYVFYEQCQKINNLDVDRTDRFNIYCEFIPPETILDFSIDFDFNEEILGSNAVVIEWWGETTPWKKEHINCS